MNSARQSAERKERRGEGAGPFGQAEAEKLTAGPARPRPRTHPARQTSVAKPTETVWWRAGARRAGRPAQKRPERDSGRRRPTGPRARGDAEKETGGGARGGAGSRSPVRQGKTLERLTVRGRPTLLRHPAGRPLIGTYPSNAGAVGTGQPWSRGKGLPLTAWSGLGPPPTHP